MGFYYVTKPLAYMTLAGLLLARGVRECGGMGVEGCYEHSGSLAEPAGNDGALPLPAEYTFVGLTTVASWCFF